MFKHPLGSNDFNIVDVMAPPMPTYVAPAEEKRNKQVSFFALYRYAKPLDIIFMVIGALAAIGTGVMTPMYVLSMGSIIDSFNYADIYAVWFSNSGSSGSSATSFTSSVNQNVYKLLYFGAISCTLMFSMNFFVNLSAKRQCNTMRKKYFENIMAQEVGWFDATQIGGLTAVITNIQQIQSGIGAPVFLVISSFSTIISVVVVGFIKEWRLGLIVTCITPFIFIISGYLSSVIGKTYIKAYISHEEAGKIAEEIISNVRTVTAFSIQDKALERYNDANKGARRAGYAQGGAKGTLFGVINFLVFSTFSIAFWYGSTLVTDGKLSPGTVITVLMSVVVGTSSLSVVSITIATIFEACGAGYEVFKIIDHKSAIDPRREEGEMIDIKGAIEFKDITFRYPTRPETIVLKNFNLKIKKGRTVAFVGSSGSGKSTVVGLLERFYDTEDGFGSVYIDGHDIKSLNLRDYRSQVGIVAQEPVLFAVTIAQNIAYGYNGEATQEMIQAAAKEANAHDFIMKLPEGYNTLVGERGTQLSGGQKQRISIARALIRKPKILIFDEATSALDTESERVVQAAIDKVAAGHTCIIIAHRLSTVRNADCIVVFDKGVVVEKGNHDELIKKGGLYKSLVERQQIQGQKPATSPGVQKRKQKVKESDDDGNGKDEAHKPDKDEAKSIKEEAFKKELAKQKPQLTLRMFKLLKDVFWPLFVSLIFSFLNGAWMPLQGFIMAKIMEVLMYDPKYADIIGVTQEEHDDSVVYWALGFIALGIGSFLFNVLQSIYLMVASERLTHYLRYEYFKAILRQETGWFDDKNNMTGILTTRLASDPAFIHMLTSTFLGLITEIVPSLCIGIIIAFIGSWRVALVVLATVPVNAVANFLLVCNATDFGQKARDAYEQCGRVASEAFENARTVMSLGREDTFLSNYLKELVKPDKIFLESTLINAFGHGFNCLYQFWVSALAFWYGGIVVENGDADFGEVMVAQFSITMGAQYIGSIGICFVDYGKAIAAAYNIFQLFDRKPAIPTPTSMHLKSMSDDRDVLSSSKNAPIPHPKPTKEDGKTYAKVTGEVEFRDVRFAYPTRPDQEILRGLSFVAKPKQTVALVGESGCGKSTVISLIERFYLPKAGEVLLDGHPIDTLEIEWFRSQIGLVSQEPTLFATTIRENIRYSKPDATDEEIIEAAKKSNAHTFITGFPDGYDTMVGEKGVTLSGGQKQRIAIARALVRNPKILLLDEATSALDAESERVVQEALDKAREGRTTITIAHRLSTIKDADAILVFEKGVIVEKGRHEELLELNGLYFNLVKAQTKET